MISILPENPAVHAPAIEALYDRTFGPGHFAKTAERLREGSASLPDCSRVAVEAGRVVAACRIWPVEIGDPATPAVFVGPLAVDEAHRGKSLGHDLVQATLKACHAQGWQLALIIGAPAYFEPLGFSRVPAGRIKLPGPQDPDRILIQSFGATAPDVHGQVRVPASRRHVV